MLPQVGVVIMAKTPQAGEVKTRLCPPLTPEEAAELYRCFLRDKIAQVRSLQAASPVIAYTPAEGRSLFEALAPGFMLLLQQGAGLGARLANCFAHLLAAGYTGVLAIDSDTPTLPTAFLQQAVDLITRPQTDVVLGPSEDGGYYLIGLRYPHRELFEGMAWSTSSVLPETLRRAEARGLKVTCLPPWFDVDTAAEVERLRAELRQADDTIARHTRRFLLSQE
jgi:rSAM/selenodomain-associated transferase 1